MIDKLTHEHLSVAEQRLNEVIDSLNEVRAWLYTSTVLKNWQMPKDDDEGSC